MQVAKLFLVVVELMCVRLSCLLCVQTHVDVDRGAIRGYRVLYLVKLCVASCLDACGDMCVVSSCILRISGGGSRCL